MNTYNVTFRKFGNEMMRTVDAENVEGAEKDILGYFGTISEIISIKLRQKNKHACEVCGLRWNEYENATCCATNDKNRISIGLKPRYQKA